MSITLLEAQLESAEMISPQVKHFVCRLTGPAFTYKAGQFITIHFKHGDAMLKRSYSIANIPNTENRIEFAANFVPDGPGTTYLFGLKPGDPLAISGPFGRLLLKDTDPKRYIFLATSTGITPYRAMLQALQERLKHNADLEVYICEGIRHIGDVLYEKDFLDVAHLHSRLKFKAFFSREDLSALKQPHHASGYVQNVLPTLDLNPNNDIIYLCGNPSMIDEAFEMLKNQGFEVSQIIREKYI